MLGDVEVGFTPHSNSKHYRGNSMNSQVKPVIASIEKVLIQGDLSTLSEGDRLTYYTRVCESLGLNPLTQPFSYIRLNGKLTLYAKRECTEQLRKIHSVSVTIVSRELVDDIYVVTARATLPDGRCDESIGAVPLGNLQGEARANGIMKAETKAKRRVTLSICGLAILDEVETDLPGAIKESDYPPALLPSASKNLITEAQVRRFITIATKEGGYTREGAKALLREWGLTSSKQITRDIYDRICTAAGDAKLAAAFNEKASAVQT